MAKMGNEYLDTYPRPYRKNFISHKRLIYHEKAIIQAVKKEKKKSVFRSETSLVTDKERSE